MDKTQHHTYTSNNHSERLYQAILSCIPGGVNSPVQSFSGLDSHSIFMATGGYRHNNATINKAEQAFKELN